MKTIIDTKIERAVDSKVEATFTEAVGSNQLKDISTDATIEIMKDDEYV